MGTWRNRADAGSPTKRSQSGSKLLLKQRNDIQKKYDHFEDLHLSGEATERQQNLMFEYEDILGVIDNFIELESERK